ncbi:MAG: hypothetical protein ACPGFC_04655, partial [Paracoccaceae bacterium]
QPDTNQGLAAALTGLSQGGAINVVSIDDTPDTTEATQERLLSALALAKLRNPMLVWRPVLAALAALEIDVVANHQQIAVICQSAKGLSVQKLHLRRASGQNRDVIAPERHHAATLVSGAIGYDALVRQARFAALGSAQITARNAHRAVARSAGSAALGRPKAGPDILRMANGDWDVVDPSTTPHHILPTPILYDPLPDLSDCAVVLVETLSVGGIRAALLDRIEQAAPGRVRALDTRAVAKGALIAAQRHSVGEPVYFDFLPGLSTIVVDWQGASRYDLIKASETLIAGQVYRSPHPAHLTIPAGETSISVFLHKETEVRPRQATVDLGAPLTQQTPVSLWVEQKPAAGRARIVMEAPALHRSFTIDWDAAAPDPRSWADVLRDLEVATTIPQRLVLPCSPLPWGGTARRTGLRALLRAPDVDWAALAGQLASARRGAYCISSDGVGPTEVAVSDLKRLDHVTAQAVSLLRARFMQDAPPPHPLASLGPETNDVLKALTWQFRRCPPQVAEWLLEAIEHPDSYLGRSAGSRVLIYQGLGRIISTPEHEARAIRLLMASDPQGWTSRTQTACMAFILSRSDTAPQLLERRDVERLAAHVIAACQHRVATPSTTFQYTLFLMAGLLRWRLKVPMALLVGVDPLADAIVSALGMVHTALGQGRTSASQAKHRKIITDLMAELKGQGTNHTLLLNIYADDAL